MLNVVQLEREIQAKKTDGLALLKATTEKCETENRAMTPEETAAIKKFSTEGLELQAKLERLQGSDAMAAELNRLAGSVQVARSLARSGVPISLGEQFIRSDAYEFIRKGGHKSQSAWRTPSAELELPGGSWFRAATLTEDPASGGALITPQYLPGILPLPTRRPVVADLIAPGTAESNVISYMREKTFTNAAATVLEGGVKPESTLTFEAATDPVRKIAHWLPVTEEMLEDAPQIRSYIDARLRTGVMLEEEDQLLNGTGVAPDLLGLMLRPGLAPDVTQTAPETLADAYLRQIMALFNSSLLMPEGIIANPNDWVGILLTKTTTGEYLAGGPFASIPTPTLWGLPVVPTPAMAAGTGLVGAYQSAAQVFRRGGIRVEASNSHADFFIKNLVAIRAEERLALAVYRPGAFGKVIKTP
jgi:HK97 family phage major capsid protein